MGRSSCRLSHHPEKFGGHMHCCSEDVMVLACHVILQGHVIMTLWIEAPQGK